MLTMSGTTPNGDVYTNIVHADVPTAREAMFRGFKYAANWKAMSLVLNGNPIASLYRDFSGAPVWR